MEDYIYEKVFVHTTQNTAWFGERAAFGVDFSPANRRGSSLQDLGRWPNKIQWPGQFIGFRAYFSFSTSKLNRFSA